MFDNELLENKMKHGIDKANLDITVNPGEDFYMYACGGWKKNNPLGAEYARFGTFDKLRENAREQLKELILNLKNDSESKVKGTNAQKINDLYSLGMDEVRLNKEGASPILPMIEKIENMSKESFFTVLAWIHNGLGSPFFGTGVGSDPGNADINVMHIMEAGLGLGDRDYYLEVNDGNRRILDAYERYVKKLIELIGLDEENQIRIWNNVISIEREFALHKKTREERRDPLLSYNMMSLEEIKDRFPNINWDIYFRELGVDNIKRANITSIKFIEFLNGFLPTLSERQIKDLMIFKLISSSSSLMSDDFSAADFELYDRVMSGVEEMEPRWKRVMTIPNSMFGEAVGQLYVEKFFPERNKEYMKELVANLKKALQKHIKALTWMSDETKQKALEKLDTLKVKIGYPDKWKDYSGIEIDPEKSYLENVSEASKWYAQDNYSKNEKPVDKDEWHMTPQTVNAYYSPSTNEICFPAAILQAPYFDVDADDALNYGAIGVVIGHEMTHGFDDSGRKFDSDGNLNEWWTTKDAEEFNKLAEKLEKQFNSVEVAPGVYANGKFTLGENIADQGGLRIALTAYKEVIKNDVSSELDGLSPLQRFYLSYANVWADNIRDEEILVRTKTDPHSLGRYRVNETLRNLTPFFDAFSIKEGDKMFREESERVVIW